LGSRFFSFFLPNDDFSFEIASGSWFRALFPAKVEN